MFVSLVIRMYYVFAFMKKENLMVMHFTSSLWEIRLVFHLVWLSTSLMISMSFDM